MSLLLAVSYRPCTHDISLALSHQRHLPPARSQHPAQPANQTCLWQSFYTIVSSCASRFVQQRAGALLEDLVGWTANGSRWQTLRSICPQSSATEAVSYNQQLYAPFCAAVHCWCTAATAPDVTPDSLAVAAAARLPLPTNQNRHHYSSLALLDTKIIAKLISLPPPAAFARVLPALLAASVALVVIITLAAWGVHVWRALQQRSSSMSSSSTRSRARCGLLIAAGIANTLLYVLLVWMVVMFAISLLWLGGGMIASKATMDGANTLTVVDETLPKLIKAAMGIDPAKAVSLCAFGLLCFLRSSCVCASQQSAAVAATVWM
jgi:hypothetical protein